MREKDEGKALTTRTERRGVLAQIIRTKLSDFMDEDGFVRTDRAAYNTAGVQSINQWRYTNKQGETGTRTSINLRDPVPAIKEDNLMTGVYKDGGTTNNFLIAFIIGRGYDNRDKAEGKLLLESD